MEKSTSWDEIVMYCIFILSPHSVISMSVLYVLTLHHRGDVTDGYVLWMKSHTSDLYRKKSNFSSLVSLRIMMSVLTFHSYVPSCVLYISWMPIFTATVTFCPPVCPWYAFDICLFPATSLTVWPTVLFQPYLWLLSWVFLLSRVKGDRDHASLIQTRKKFIRF